MTHSLACTHLAMQFEGLRLTAYADSVGVATIGYGHTQGVHLGDTCTQDQAEVWLDCDMRTADDAVNRLVKVPLAQAQFDALVDFVFNLGQGSLAGSTLLKRVNACEWEAAAEEFGKWVYAGGKVLPGLVARRKAEADLFRSAPSVTLVPSKEQIDTAAEENNIG